MMAKWSATRVLRVAIGLELIGLACELVAVLDLTPGTFLLFMGVGTPCLGLGALLFVAYLYRSLTDKGAL